MTSRARRGALVSALAAVALCAFAAGRSPSVRTSFDAAYRAFRDPTLLGKPASPALSDALARCPPAEPELLDADIARDFDLAGGEDLESPEGTTVRSLSLPDLGIPITRRTLRFVRFFARNDAGRTGFVQRFQRAGRYRAHIEHALREAGLPEELVWLAAIESGFDPRAVSPKGAAGLFQFMPETGVLYGLDVSPWIDERRSIRRATIASVAHLRDLYERFRRWDLALAAYNLGVDGVVQAMQRVADARGPAGAGKPISLQDLSDARLIPEETINYVPQIAAFAIVAANRARFGLDPLPTEAPLELGELAVPEGTRLRTVARATGVSSSVLRDYNPELLRDRVPPIGGDYLLAIPADRVQHALAALPAYLDQDRAGEPVDAPPSTSPPGADLAAGEVAFEPLPPRPFPLGPNRLPDFSLPASEVERPSGLGMPGLAALGANLPAAVLGGGAGWLAQRGQGQDDGLGTLGSSPGSASATRGHTASIGKHLGLLNPPQTIPASRDPFERFVLPSGVTVLLRDDPAAARVAITVRIAPEGDVDHASVPASAIHGGTGEMRHTLAVPERDLDVGLNLAAARLRLWLDEAGGAELAALRRRVAEPRRSALQTAPYGPAWLMLGDTLFPDGHPLAGTLLGAWEDSDFARDMLLLETLRSERVAARASVTVVGHASKERVRKLVTMFLGSVGAPANQPVPPYPREERLTVEQAVPSERVLYGWIVPGEADPAFAAMNVAVAILSAPKLARLDRVLVEPGYAARVRTELDIGSLASTAAIEIIPAIPHDIAEVERRMDAEIEALASTGPTVQEVVYAQSLLRLRARKEAESTGGVVPAGAPRTTNSARLRAMLDPKAADRFLASLSEVTPQAVRAVVRRSLDRTHRVVVITRPRS